MGIPVRPTKPIGGGGTDAWTTGSDLYANELNEDITPLYTEIANIQDVNVAALAAINGSKIADAPNGIPTAKINNNAVTTPKIEDDAVDAAKLKDSVGVDGDRAVTSNHIRNAAATLIKIKRTTYTNAGGIGPIAAGSFAAHNTSLAIATTLPVATYLTVSPHASLLLFQNGGTWWVQINNHSAAPFSVNIGELKVEYLD